MKMIKLMIIIIAAGLLSCDDEPFITPEPPTVEEDTIFELLWATRLDFNRTIVNHNNGIFYENEYIFFGDIDSSATIYAFDADLGDKTWTYRYTGWDNSDIEYNYWFEGIIICITSRRVFGFEIISQSVIWEHNLSSQNLLRDSGNMASNGKFYMNVAENFDPLGGFNEYILEFDPFTGEKREVVKYTPDSIGTKTLSPPVYYQDDIILYNLRPNGELPPEYTKQYMVAYDMNINQELWRTEVTESFASNGLHPPIIYNNTVITGGDWSMYAFDVLTGEQLWRTPIPGYDRFGIFAKTNHLIHNGRLYVNETGPNLTCINPETGDIIWNNTDAANCTDNMVYYQDMLVFASFGEGSVLVIDALTGETLHKEGPYDNSIFNNDVVYDEVRDMFFTSTYKHAIGFKVHKPE